MGDVTVLGVRHHGPGSARAVGEALAELQPDAVLIEGAPELDAVAALAGGADMAPPLAGSVYAVIEHRYHGAGIFAVVTEAMATLRQGGETDEHNERREAAMRKVIRAALAGGAGRVAVVCGAWHAPALLPEAFPAASADVARLRG